MNIFSNPQDVAGQNLLATLNPLTEEALAFAEFDKLAQIVLWVGMVVFCLLLLSVFIAHRKQNRFAKRRCICLARETP